MSLTGGLSVSSAVTLSSAHHAGHRWAWLAAVLGVLGPAPLRAHNLPPSRRVLASARLEPPARGGALRVDVMVWMRVPAGRRSTALQARYDLDRSGRLEAPEARMLADALAPEAIGGFILRIDHRSRAPQSAESQARIEPDGALAIAVLLPYALPEPLTAPTTIEMTTRPDIEPQSATRAGALEAQLSILAPLRRAPPQATQPAPDPPLRPVLGPQILSPAHPSLTATVVVAASASAPGHGSRPKEGTQPDRQAVEDRSGTGTAPPPAHRTHSLQPH